MENETYIVADVMSPKFIAVDSQKSVTEAAKLLKAHKVSSLIVKKNGEIIGIVTDKDFSLTRIFQIL
jgi:CBS domain-containing protein